MIRFKTIPKLSTREQREFWLQAQRLANGCLVWTGTQQTYGAGVFYKDGRMFNAARIAYVLSAGKRLQQGNLVCHHCDNPPCIEPTHLFVGSYKDNAQDAVKKGRWPHGDTHYLRDPAKYAERVARLRSTEGREANRQGQLGRKLSVETKVKISAARVRWWTGPEAAALRLKLSERMSRLNKTEFRGIRWKKHV